MKKIDPNYLRRTAESPGIRAVKLRAYELLGLRESGRVVDVGCGPAIDTPALARIVGPAGLVIGVDADPDMVEHANRLAAEEGIGTFTRHVVADATALPFDAASADACFSERLLQHLHWPAAQCAVREIVRIVRPGGRVAVCDTDWGSLSIAASDPTVERRVVQQHIYGFSNPFSGRYLPAMFTQAGLLDLSVETFALQLSFESVEFLLSPTLGLSVASGRMHRTEADGWWRDLRYQRDHLQFFAHVSMVLVAGRAP